MARYIWLCIGIKKGLNPLDLSLSALYNVMFSHIKLGIWWRWRQLNSKPNSFILNTILQI